MIIHTHFSDGARIDAHSSGFEISQLGQIVGSQLDQQMFDDDSLTSVSEKLNLLNGFYAICWARPGLLLAAVDQVRSFPLFYADGCTEFYLSDSAEWVRSQIGDAEMCSLAQQEFVMTGCVTGPDTLYKKVKQLQAGEVLEVREIDGKASLRRRQYYSFEHNEPAAFDEKVLSDKLNSAVSDCIDNLISFADGKQIAIPLSGGFDSRLIATILKEKKYENVITFTYGVAGNKESFFSKQVAKNLGLEWIYLEYNDLRWHQMIDNPERWRYQLMASGLCSQPHIQDWIAVNILKDDPRIHKDCIFVPGHSADFVAGSHIPERAFINDSFTQEEVLDSIFSTWYSNSPLNEANFKKSVWFERILKSTSIKADNTPWEYADRFEHWDWQERQAKFICNSVRLYEFFEFNWWMPFWDRTFMDFWLDVPLYLREDRAWYKEYVQKKYIDNINAEQEMSLGNAVDDPWLVSFLRKSYIFRISGFRKFASFFWQKLRNMFIKHDSLELGSLIPSQRFKILEKQGYKTNGMQSYEFLREYKKMMLNKKNDC
jgi:asparagine synthase (glutamine-hydrolysing)